MEKNVFLRVQLGSKFGPTFFLWADKKGRESALFLNNLFSALSY